LSSTVGLSLTHLRYSSATTSHRSLVYRPDIDGLRAIAVAAVLAFHAFPEWLPGGFLGVDVFFVISGYLIGGIVFKEVALGTFTLKSFYRRRIVRLFPALATVLVACLLLGSIVLFDSEYASLARHTIAGAFGFVNIQLWSEVGYFDSASQTKPLLHLWSLGVEEQFYLAFPIAVAVLSRRRRAVQVGIAGFAVASFVLGLNLGGYFSSGTIFFIPIFRAWELMAGVILAYSADRFDADRLKNVLAPLGLAAIAASVFIFSSANISTMGALFPVMGTVLVIAAGPLAWVNRWVLAARVVVFVGLISYPLYLWHWPLISFVHILYPEAGAIARSALLAASVGLATLTWLYIERPVQRFAAAHRLVPYALTAASAFVVLAAAGVVARSGQVGWAARGGAVSAFLAPSLANDTKCAIAAWGVPSVSGILTRCTDPSPQAGPSVALIGDSHAHHLFAGVERYYAKRGQNVISFSAYGCSLFFEAQPEGCSEKYARIWRKLDALESVDTVLLSTYTPYLKAENPHYERSVRELAQRLTSSGVHLVLMLDVPEVGINPRDCVIRPLQFWRALGDVDCSVDRKIYDQRVKDYRRTIASALQGVPGVAIFDPAPVLCDVSRCNIRAGGALLYRDSNHLNDAGSRYLSEHFDF
jgi:peptidoglycan/LPS O-acetylase OafA/YrhL